MQFANRLSVLGTMDTLEQAMAFNIEQFKKDKDTRETEPGKYWNPRKKLLIKQNPPMGRPEILPEERKRTAKAIMQKKAVLDKLAK